MICSSMFPCYIFTILSKHLEALEFKSN